MDVFLGRLLNLKDKDNVCNFILFLLNCIHHHQQQADVAKHNIYPGREGQFGIVVT